MRSRVLRGDTSYIVNFVIIAMVLLFLGFMFFGDGLFTKSAKALDVESSINPLKEDFEQLPLPEAPPSVLDMFDSMVTAFNSGATGPCLISYKSAAMEKWTISMVATPTGTDFILKSPNGLTIKEAAGTAQMCVVGGKLDDAYVTVDGEPLVYIESDTSFIIQNDQFDDIILEFGDGLNLPAHNFYGNWIKEYTETPEKKSLVNEARTRLKRYVTPDYMDFENIVITSKDEMIVGAEKFGKQDGGLLYVPEDGRVCLMGTIGDYFNSYSEKGIHTNSIPSLKESTSPLKTC